MIVHILDQKPIYSQVALLFRSELLEKLESLPNVQKIKQSYKVSVVKSVFETGRLIALEANANDPNSQMVGQSAP
jgi:hypothetical protein